MTRAGFALAAVLMAASVPGRAAGVRLLGPKSTGLTQQDTTLLSGSIARLNRQRDLKVGATDTWSNAATGSRGENVVTKIFHEGGTTCHELRHQIVVKGHEPARSYTLTWCRVPDGDWKIKS